MNKVALIFLLFSISQSYSQSFEWAKNVGSDDRDVGYAITLDDVGNVYITGAFQGVSDFDPSGGEFELESIGGYDIFVLKLTSEGSLVWAKSMGGDGNETGTALKIDKDGNLIVVGNYEETVDFDPDGGVSNLTSAGGEDIFILKLNLDGDFIWAKSVGGPDAEDGHSVACDNDGRILVTGSFEGTTDFDPGAAVFNHTSEGGEDIFILQLNSGGELNWAKRIGGTFDDRGNGIEVDGWGNVYVVGQYYFSSVDFDPNEGTYILGNYGAREAFVLKLDVEGSFNWAKRIGGEWNEIGVAIAIGPAGYVYVTGMFQGTVDFDTGDGVDYLSAEFGLDIFLLKLDQEGIYKWANHMYASGWEYVYAIDIDRNGQVYITGVESNTSGPGSLHNIIVISKVNVDGSPIWVQKIGHLSSDERAYGIAVDAYSNVYITGEFENEIDFDPSEGGVFELEPNGTSIASDAFILKIAAEEDVGIHNSEDLEMNIYPNPACNRITLDFSKDLNNTDVQIYDLMGKLVLQAKVLSNTIDVSGLSNGTYYFNLRLASGDTLLKRFVVNR